MLYLELKQLKAGNGKVYNSKTKECYDGVTNVTIDACFRAYSSFADSISDYFDLICKNSRYKKAINSSSPEECIKAIEDGGYATDPKYVDSILKIIKSNKLEQYDRKEKESKKEDYIIGKTYTLQVNLNVRIGAGTSYKNKKYSELTKDGRKHALNISNAVLKRGTKVTCLKVIKVKDETWIEIPSGYICGKYGDKVYVK